METVKKVVDAVFGGVRFTAAGIGKVLLTILLIGLLTGILFMCIFAYYVKTTLTDDIDLSLEDFNVNESSRILYQDKASGEWKELTMIQSDEKRIWIDYDQIPQDMLDVLHLTEEGHIRPGALVSHILGLNAAADTLLAMEKPDGAKKICYNELDLPLTAIADFAELGKTDPMFAQLHTLVQRHGGLWNAEAEAYLLENCPKL